MAAARWPSPPAISCSPRARTNPSSYASIDSVLKELKSCSRRLQTVFSAYHDELQTLERLYYKGKNQHRSALFWKRVAEIKRYGKRLHRICLPETLARLRCSFFGTTTIQNVKSMRGSWTHIPNSAYVIFVADQLAACFILLNKFHERLLDIYRSFKLAMQSGAFVQLLLTLAAIAARMSALVADFQDVIRCGWMINYRILKILDPGQAQRIKSVRTVHVGTHHEYTSAVIALDAEMSSNEASLCEDTGSSAKQAILIAPSSSQNTVDVVSSHEHTFPSINDANDSFPFATVVNDKPLHTATTGQLDIERKVVQKQVFEINKMPKYSTKGEEAPIILPQKKAKKTKRNEIDEIFGF